MKKLKFLFVFGTRPEAIKLYPVIMKFNEQPSFDVIVVNTGQQKEMLDQTIYSLGIKIDIDLAIMTENQTLATLSSNLFLKLDNIYESELPDYVFIHGDTTTSMVAGIVAKFHKIKVVHVESGLRSNDIYSPWPEELNRKINSISSDYHMAPTKVAKENLLLEGISSDKIIITGNTGIDTLRLLTKSQANEDLEIKYFHLHQSQDLMKTVLITIHRRENFEKLEEIFDAIKLLSNRNSLYNFIYPVHLNPNVRVLAYRLLSGIDNLKLISPLEYRDFIYLLGKCHFVITDSGGIQEEATYLGKPIILCRDSTERPEGLLTNNIILAGTSKNSIMEFSNKLIDNFNFYENSSTPSNVFGDGYAAERILDWITSLDKQSY